MSNELLGPLDLAFWHADSQDHPLHMGALAVFAPVAGRGPREVAELLAARAAQVPRLRRRVRDVWMPVGAAAWVDDPRFDVRRHVYLHREWPELAAELMERPLNRDRPPWEIHVIEGADGEPFSVLLKIHHALADGLRAVSLGAVLFDESPGLVRLTAPRKAAPPAVAGPGPGLRSRVGAAVGAAVGEAGQALGIGAAMARASLGASVGSRTIPALAAPSSGSRQLATAVLDLDAVQLIRKAGGGTVNDVLIAMVAGMLRRWMSERGEDVTTAVPRALVPVSRRPGDGHRGAGNRLSGYLAELPVAEPDPLRRLDAVRGVMDRNKAAGPGRGPGAAVLLTDYLLPVASRLGAPLAGHAVRLLFDILVTSVPVPDLGFTVGGCPLTALYPLAPLARGQSLAVAMTTYRGKVHLGLVGDGCAAPDLQLLADAAHAELADLGAAVA
ncbi:wax ester/triacylglycerol synthase family O-acyltransferase [Streptomyces sp. NBC_01262]|jgi:WS/DGAT/MGAT family acyltransferase|uniref:wax ester/triacylglycerol synthase family O-acyltransferase n=1 Tax=Streptomyces sp. NBC_01262 TaxID=2903803 RepID=UPI002E33A5C7|nr:wax ester/triacylglycerol synthase family O-acyltransferase [Streptomyces sp. NBC_01262]